MDALLPAYGTCIVMGSMIENGEREGKWKWYYNSGKLKETDNFINGKREDTVKLWYEKRSPKAVYVFHNDLFEGDCREYNVSGIMTTKANYEANKLSGPATYFYDDGKLQYLTNYTER